MLVIVLSFTDAQKKAFIEGWENAGGFVDDPDNPCPWCCPWEWTDEIEVEGENFEEMGADWWHRNRDEIESLIAEENEARAAADEDE